jgi:hypothetical protein
MLVFLYKFNYCNSNISYISSISDITFTKFKFAKYRILFINSKEFDFNILKIEIAVCYATFAIPKQIYLI